MMFWYFFISYMIPAGLSLAFVLDEENGQKWNVWAYLGAVFWPIPTAWVIYCFWRDHNAREPEE